MHHRMQSSFFQNVIHAKGEKCPHDTISLENGSLFNSTRDTISEHENKNGKVHMKENWS